MTFIISILLKSEVQDRIVNHFNIDIIHISNNDAIFIRTKGDILKIY